MGEQAERARLISMLANGPERRMAQDAAQGRGAQRADELQARTYRARLAALDRGPEATDLVTIETPSNDPLGLDRSGLD